MFLFILIAGFFCSIAADAAEMYVKKPFEMKYGMVTALVQHGARVEGMPYKNGWRVKGRFWVSQGGRLYSSKDDEITMGFIKSGSDKSKSGYAEFQAKTGRDFLAGSLAESLNELDELYLERCSTCHHVYEPVTYTADRWKTVMSSMRVQAGVSDSEYLQIMRFLCLTAAKE